MATVTYDQAFDLVGRVDQVQEAKRTYGSRFAMVLTRDDKQFYYVGVGEHFPERVRFDRHYQVSKADGTVCYDDVIHVQCVPVTMK